MADKMSEAMNLVLAVDKLKAVGESELARAVRDMIYRNATATPPADAAHQDDVAVDRFAAAMKAKMGASRAKGRGGWESTDLCPPGRLQKMLADHLSKGDPVDVGNFAMMLFNRGEKTTQPPPADAALADVLDSRASMLAIRHTDDPDVLLMRQAAAALRARAVQVCWPLVYADSALDYILENHPNVYAECGDDEKFRAERKAMLAASKEAK